MKSLEARLSDLAHHAERIRQLPPIDTPFDQNTGMAPAWEHRITWGVYTDTERAIAQEYGVEHVPPRPPSALTNYPPPLDPTL